MPVGSTVELFDDAGATALGAISSGDSNRLIATVQRFEPAKSNGPQQLTVAAAVPKGERAGWMVEKLSELGVGRFVPLQTRRSVVLPGGKNKFQRWKRLAVESARQSRRRGVMEISPLTTLQDALTLAPSAIYFSTRSDALPIHQYLQRPGPHGEIWLFVGPEGGWSDEEVQLFDGTGAAGVALTQTVLRIETAAVVATAVFACCRGADAIQPSQS